MFKTKPRTLPSILLGIWGLFFVLQDPRVLQAILQYRDGIEIISWPFKPSAYWGLATLLSLPFWWFRGWNIFRAAALLVSMLVTLWAWPPYTSLWTIGLVCATAPLLLPLFRRTRVSVFAVSVVAFTSLFWGPKPPLNVEVERIAELDCEKRIEALNALALRAHALPFVDSALIHSEKFCSQPVLVSSDSLIGAYRLVNFRNGDMHWQANMVMHKVDTGWEAVSGWRVPMEQTWKLDHMADSMRIIFMTVPNHQSNDEKKESLVVLDLRAPEQQVVLLAKGSQKNPDLGYEVQVHSQIEAPTGGTALVLRTSREIKPAGFHCAILDTVIWKYESTDTVRWSKDDFAHKAPEIILHGPKEPLNVDFDLDWMLYREAFLSMQNSPDSCLANWAKEFTPSNEVPYVYQSAPWELRAEFKGVKAGTFLEVRKNFRVTHRDTIPKACYPEGGVRNESRGPALELWCSSADMEPGQADVGLYYFGDAPGMGESKRVTEEAQQ